MYACIIRGGPGGIEIIEGGSFCERDLLDVCARVVEAVRGRGITFIKFATGDGRVVSAYISSDGQFYAIVYSVEKDVSEEDIFAYLDAYAANLELERLRQSLEPS